MFIVTKVPLIRYSFVVFLSLLLSCLPLAAGELTPLVRNDLHKVQLAVPEKFSGVQSIANRFLTIPKGFTASVFHYSTDLSKPRFIAFSPDGVLYVANKNSGTVVALPDSDNDNCADSTIVIASNLGSIHDIRFSGNYMYVTETNKVYRFSPGNQAYQWNAEVFIDGIASGSQQPGGGHDTRTIAIDNSNNKLYLSIGSLCNACREEQRAIVEEYNLSTGDKISVFATGIRNAVGMQVRPGTAQLWATNNGSDLQGNQIPPEWIDIVRKDGFYGYPFAYGTGEFFPTYQLPGYKDLLPITAQDSALAASMIKPAALITAHSAPMAIVFGTENMPAGFQNGAFVASRGSWNRSPATGYEVLYLHLSSLKDTTVDSISVFAQGFLTDSVSVTRWARPVGLAIDSSGSLYMSSDAINEMIIKFTPDPQHSSSTLGSPQPHIAQKNTASPGTYLLSGRKLISKTRLLTNKKTGVDVARISHGENQTILLQ